MVLTVSTGLCALPRLWQRQDGLMLTCRTPLFCRKRGCFLSIKISCLVGCFRQERRESRCYHEGGTKENAQTSVNQTVPGCFPTLQSYRFCEWLCAHTATRLETCSEGCSVQNFSETWNRPPSPLHCPSPVLTPWRLCHWSVGVIWGLFDSPRSWCLLGVFERCVLPRFVLLCLTLWSQGSCLM